MKVLSAKSFNNLLPQVKDIKRTADETGAALGELAESVEGVLLEIDSALDALGGNVENLFPKTGGTITGNVDMSGMNITRVGTITANTFNGNATSASKLKNSVKINGVDFDGTSDINIGSSELNMASADTIGGIRVGSGLSIDSNGILSTNVVNISGTAGNVTGVVAIANGGTGGNTVSKAVENLFNNSNNNPGYFAVFNSNWASTGYISTDNVKTLLGVGSNIKSPNGTKNITVNNDGHIVFNNGTELWVA